MEKQTKNNLKINGIGSSAGGNFNLVSIEGKGEINGDVHCNDFNINGLGNVNGNVFARIFKVSGKSEISGDLDCGSITADGKLEVNGNVKVSTFENHGMFKITGEVSTESFYSHGGFRISGLLNAGKIQILVNFPCSAKEIGGEEIEIKSRGTFGLRKIIGLMLPGLSRQVVLTTDTIEGDNIYLENTIAKIVRGHNVKIGPDCQIDLVEYKNTFHKGTQSNIKIKESRKI